MIFALPACPYIPIVRRRTVSRRAPLVPSSLIGIQQVDHAPRAARHIQTPPAVSPVLADLQSEILQCILRILPVYDKPVHRDVLIRTPVVVQIELVVQRIGIPMIFALPACMPAPVTGRSTVPCRTSHIDTSFNPIEQICQSATVLNVYSSDPSGFPRIGTQIFIHSAQ